MLNDLGIISSPGFAEVDQAVFLSLQKSRYQIELYHESMELTLFPDEDSQLRFREQFVRKYSNRTPDVIIAAGSASLKFIADSNERFLRDTPIVFCAITGEIPDQLKPDMHFTGVLGRLHPAETLNAALLLLPGTEHVVVVGGVGKFDQTFEAIAKQGFHSYESKLEFTYLTNLTMPSLLEQLKHLPSKTIVYHTSITRDAAGERFIDSAQSVPLVASAANAPVFVMDDVDLRGGTVGGDLVNWADDGRVAGEMAVRVLNGEKPEDIPIATSNNAYLFDWRALHRWGIKESNLPPGSILLNQLPSFWQLYKRYVLAGVFVILAQALVISGLLRQRSKLRKAESKLVQSNEQLRSAIAKQRQAEETLRESEERFRLMANTAPVMIWMSGTDKRCSYFNETWLAFTGRSREKELGNSWVEGVLEEDVERCLETYNGAFDRREAFETEYRLRRHDGEYRWIFGLGVPRFNPDDSFAGYIGSCIDVTERKLAEEALSSVSRRLIEAQEEERRWIARELHDDINQRLAFSAVKLDVLRRELPASAEETQRHLIELKHQISELGIDVQSLSHRLHSSKLEYLGLGAAASAFCREFSEHNGVHIDFHCDAIPKTLPTETALCLFRVLQEALRNASKHSGQQEYHVSLLSGVAEICLTVSDTGRGFDLEEALKRPGVGITSMRERLKLVGGELSIISEPGAGTVVQARVPLAVRAVSAAAARA